MGRLPLTDTGQRRALIARAIALELLTVAWMILEAAVALWSGIAARSITLVAFGADSLIEMISAFVVLWRLNVERTSGRFSEAAERRAARLGSILLFGLTAYVLAGAAWSLLTRTGERFSVPGLAVSVIAVPAMYALAKAKLRLAGALGSRALRADAAQAIACGYLSAIVVAGLVADLAFNAWWIDAVTSLGITYFLLKEAREAWSGDPCDYDR